MNDLYFLVDFDLKQIITPIDKLPEDWSNISGLNLLEGEKIKNLEWAGHKNLGWFNLKDKDLYQYEVSDQWLQSSKLKLKSLVAAQRWEKENEILTFNGKQIKIDERTKLSLIFKSFSTNQDEIVNWKFLNGTFEIQMSELTNIYNFVTSYIQQCFDVEYEFSKLVDQVKTQADLFNLNLNINWPETTL